MKIGSGTWRRRVGLIIVLVAVAWLGWQIVSTTLGSVRVNSNPAAAVGWAPGSPRALAAMAEQQLVDAEDDADMASVEDLADRALLASPLQQSALRLLALSADLRGDSERATRLMPVAGSRSAHDSVAQIWLLQQDVRSGQLEMALAEADLLLRTQPALWSQLLPVIGNIALDEKVQASLIDRLAHNPPWRTWVLTNLPKIADPSVSHAILAGLRPTSSPPSNKEVGAFLDRLIADDNFGLAYLEWVSSLPASGISKDYLYNGGFNLPATGLPFDWILPLKTDAETEIIDSADKSRGKVLHVVFLNERVARPLANKLLVLKPGSYALSGLARAENLQNERGVAWRLRCADGQKQLIVESELLSGTFKWRGFTANFSVPDDGCSAQWLSLEVAARGALEQQVSGEIWFDDLSVDRENETTEQD